MGSMNEGNENPDNNPLEDFSLNALESLRQTIITRDDAIDAKRIMDFIQNKISYDNNCHVFRYHSYIRPNNIIRLKNNGFEMYKVSIMTKNNKGPHEVYYMLSKKDLNFEAIYKEELQTWWWGEGGNKLITSSYTKL